MEETWLNHTVSLTIIIRSILQIGEVTGSAGLNSLLIWNKAKKIFLKKASFVGAFFLYRGHFPILRNKI